jgi:predicted metallo-beta-lactamase superfamily hydrolase
MKNVSEQEMLEVLGGSAARIGEDLSQFRESAQLFSSDMQGMIEDYALQWIGVYRGKVAASGKTLESLMSQLQENNIPTQDTLIRFVDKEERVLIL